MKKLILILFVIFVSCTTKEPQLHTFIVECDGKCDTLSAETFNIFPPKKDVVTYVFFINGKRVGVVNGRSIVIKRID